MALFLLILVVCIITTSCSLINTEPFVDSYLDDQGNTIIADTPRMWQMFLESLEPTILRELEGRIPPEGVVKTWSEYWIVVIKRQSRQNEGKYTNYIIQRRREEGLPEINWPNDQ